MTTADFTKMHISPRERTPIIIVSGAVRRRCSKCKRMVQPKIINSAFLAKPLEKCPLCNTVIQAEAQS